MSVTDSVLWDAIGDDFWRKSLLSFEAVAGSLLFFCCGDASLTCEDDVSDEGPRETSLRPFPTSAQSSARLSSGMPRARLFHYSGNPF